MKLPPPLSQCVLRRPYCFIYLPGTSYNSLIVFLLLLIAPPHVFHMLTHGFMDNNESLMPEDQSTSAEAIDTTGHYVQTNDILGIEDHLLNLKKKIPMKLLKQLQDIVSYEELMQKVSGPGKKISYRSLGKTSRRQGRKKNDNSSNPELGPIFDKRAFCQPRRVPVHVPQPTDPMLIYQPMCLQIERCGGCCAHELFRCVPALKRNASRKIVSLRYPHAGADFFEFEKVSTIKIERHIRCKCQCKIQPEDCTVHQVYLKDSCRCACPKANGLLKCKPPQIWNEHDCRCRCPDQDDCSTGTYFDPRVCRCRSMAEILAYARIYKNPWLKSHLPQLPKNT